MTLEKNQHWTFKILVSLTEITLDEICQSWTNTPRLCRWESDYYCMVPPSSGPNRAKQSAMPAMMSMLARARPDHYAIIIPLPLANLFVDWLVCDVCMYVYWDEGSIPLKWPLCAPLSTE